MDESLPPVSHCASPETSVSAVQCYEGSPGSPMKSISGSTIGKASEGTMSIISYNQELDFDIKLGSFAPRWDVFPEICNFSPLKNLSPSDDGASASSKTTETKILQTRDISGNLWQLHLIVGVVHQSLGYLGLVKAR